MYKPTTSRATLFAALLGVALLLPTTASAAHHEEAAQEGESMAHDAMSGEAMDEAPDAMGNEDAMAPDDGDDMMMEDDAMMEDDGEM